MLFRTRRIGVGHSRLPASLAMTALASLAIVVVQTMPGAAARAAEPQFRPPAVPLVTNDPYLSIWSKGDRLTDVNTTHWTGKPHSLLSMIRIDGKTFRLMGADPKDVPAFPQVGLKVLATRSIYDFDDGHVHVTLTFMTPFLPADLDVLARPVTYLTWQVRSVDGAEHAVRLFDSVSSQLAVNTEDQEVAWDRQPAGALTALRVGTVDQTLFEPRGDGVRIDWGYAYAAAAALECKSAIGACEALTGSFASSGDIATADDANQPREVKKDQPVLAFTFDLGKVAAQPVSRHVIVAYDEPYSINYFSRKLRPYWRKDGASATAMLQAAEKDYPALQQRCETFDKELWADLAKVGGERYAQVAALAYREAIAACGLAADVNKQPLLFTKENTSNGDIATVDVIFPMDPIFVALSPALAKASLVPVLNYGASARWKLAWAPHDLGTYPVCTGYDNGGENMPVEESGNVLILVDAICQIDGKPDFANLYWPQLTSWAKYLEQFGLDPENQLCTDDFMGHLAHNSNLSIKAIIALAAYGDMARMRGETAVADTYTAMAKADAAHWVKTAAEGDHFTLAFDKPNTWSQKYNLVWDKVLGLNVFPPEVARKEIAHYKTVQQKYGVPLDSRTKLTKSDWLTWCATMAENQADFESLLSPLYDYLNETTAREALADSYHTDNVKSGGMHARPVVGGIFIKILGDKAMWKKWAAAAAPSPVKFEALPLPTPPKTVDVIPAADHAKNIWHYTLDKPAAHWFEASFDDSSWKQGEAGFGPTHQKVDVPLRTNWKTDDIWIRRQITMPATAAPNMQFKVYHDEDIEIYVDGVLALKKARFNNGYELFDIALKARRLLKPGAKLTLAAHCHQTIGGQGIDIGLVNIEE